MHTKWIKNTLANMQTICLQNYRSNCITNILHSSGLHRHGSSINYVIGPVVY